MKTTAFTLLAFGIAGPALALPDGQFTRQELVDPGYMTSTCGGLSSGNWITAGDAVLFQGDKSCTSATSALPAGAVGSSASFTAPAVAADAWAQAGFGWVRMHADFSGPNDAYFPAAFATAGWMDTLTITAPGLSGQAGTLNFLLHVDGALQARAGWNSGAGFQLTPFSNGATGVPASQFWGGQGQVNFPYDQGLDVDVAFALPFTFGTAFDLGVFGQAKAGTASFGGVSLINTAFVDIDGGGLHWGGITGVSASGASVSYSLSASSGIDWTQPISAPVPEPASALLLLAGLTFVARRRLGVSQPLEI